MSKVNIFLNKEIKCPVSDSEVLRIAQISSEVEKKIKGDVEINIIGDDLMKRLNNKYRKKNKTTDVLSFAWSEDGIIQSKMLGQIYISLPQIKRQAKENGMKENKEFAKILVHGLLHLAGYDHQIDAEEKKMVRVENNIANKL